jgi:hypothetical protein
MPKDVCLVVNSVAVSKNIPTTFNEHMLHFVGLQVTTTNEAGCLVKTHAFSM